MTPPVQSAVAGAVTVAADAGGPEPTWPPQRPLELPVTVSDPDPALLSTMPLAAPLLAMLWNVRPLAPIVVLATLRAVPVVESIVLAFVPVVTLIVPPPVALRP